MERSIEVSAKSRQQAIEVALKKLGVGRDEVQIDVLDEGSAGIFGFGARDVRLRVSTDVPGSDHGAGEAAALLQEILSRMGMEATVRCEVAGSGETCLKVESPDSAILIGRKGRTLAALQYLINRIIHRTEGEDVERIAVDVEGYADRRRESLEELAQRLAARVKESGRRMRVKPMTAQERRVIHVALENDPDVRTFSIGDGDDRCVVIALKDDQGDSDRRDRPRGDRRRGGGPRGEGQRGYPADRGERGQRGGGYGRESGGRHRDTRGPRSPRGSQRPTGGGGYRERNPEPGNRYGGSPRGRGGRGPRDLRGRPRPPRPDQGPPPGDSPDDGEAQSA